MTQAQALSTPSSRDEAKGSYYESEFGDKADHIPVFVYYSGSPPLTEWLLDCTWVATIATHLRISDGNRALVKQVMMDVLDQGEAYRPTRCPLAQLWGTCTHRRLHLVRRGRLAALEQGHAAAQNDGGVLHAEKPRTLMKYPDEAVAENYTAADAESSP